MQIKVESGDITKHPSKALVVNLFEGVKKPGGATGAVDKALGGGIGALISEGELKGKSGEVTLVHSLGQIASPRVLVAGLGKQDAFGVNVIRDITGTALRRARATGATTVATILHGAGIAGLDAEQCAQAIAEGAVMGAYRFRRYKDNSNGEDPKEIETLTIVEQDKSKLNAVRRGAERGLVLGQAANHTRDMANEPANELPPAKLAERAQALAAEVGLECEVLNEKQLARLRMGGVLGVGSGSSTAAEARPTTEWL
ncbi:MAG: hypothetical protein E6J43_01145 [Chloroflexi bacterium]|nr:MAG: hypothetical protein E6J43_01145 [Chloroflexota bacterium]